MLQGHNCLLLVVMLSCAPIPVRLCEQCADEQVNIAVPGADGRPPGDEAAQRHHWESTRSRAGMPPLVVDPCRLCLLELLTCLCYFKRKTERCTRTNCFCEVPTPNLHCATGPALAGEMGLHGVVAGTLDVQCSWAGPPRPAQRGTSGGQHAASSAAARPPMPPPPAPQRAPRPPLPLDGQQRVGAIVAERRQWLRDEITKHEPDCTDGLQ